MSLKIALLLASFAGVIGIVLGYFLRWLVTLGKRGSLELEVKQMILAAKEQAQGIVEEAEKKGLALLEDVRREEKEKQGHFKQTEDRLIKKEALLDRRQTDIDEEADRLKKRELDLDSLKTEVGVSQARVQSELERIANLSAQDARKELFKHLEDVSQDDIMARIRKLENEGVEKLERKAKDILATSIQRLAASTASETMATAVTIPSEDIKGKIIGKEGRNIRAFERAAGVELIVDDTPGAIIISSFDPVRRQIARVALENLILDGRIQPVKIEEMVEKARETIQKTIKEKGEQAAYECSVFNLDPRLIMILGRLYFRTSYGQNVLQHSIEMAHIAGMIAQELGADVQVARAGALLHDIGKAVDHEVQGTHVEIGRRILQKFSVDERIIKAMQSHHEEYPYETIESIIVQTADAISGGRPGARRDSVENYIKRLQDLEAIANSFEGVEKSYAIQAGREIRIFVNPEKISDTVARDLARNIAIRIENELKYPGEIRVSVIRELRVLDYAR